MAKNLSIVAQGISGDEGHLLGYNVSDNGIYTPAIGDVVRGTNATYVAQDGLLKTAPPNVARVDYTNGVAEVLSEVSSTNLVTYSENFSQWVAFGGQSITPNYALAPNGENVASRIIFSSSNQILRTDVSLPIGVQCSGSVFIKGVKGETITLTTGGADELKVLSGEWERITSTKISLASFLIIGTFGGATARDFLLWGAQLEQGLTTSYVPTNGSSATRSADSMTNFGNSQIIDSQSGVLLFEGYFFEGFFGMQSAISNFRVLVGYAGSNPRKIYYYINDSVTEVIPQTYDYLKIVLKYNNGIQECYVNGVLEGTSTYSTPTDLSFLDLSGFQGRIRKLKYLPYNTDISKL